MTYTLWRAGVCALVALSFAAPAALAQTVDEKLQLGREVFLERAQPSCTICHTLADAGSDGAIGPVLDDLKPTAEQVRLAVTLGVGPMQPYTDKLSKEEIEALAYYVSTVTGGAEAAESP